MSDSEFITDPDLQINFFSSLRHSVSLTEIVEQSVKSPEEALTDLRFALKDTAVGKYLVPAPGCGTLPVHNHEPFHLYGWRGYTGNYCLYYTSPDAFPHEPGTTDLERCLKLYKKPWDVKIRSISALEEEKGDFFGPVPKRLNKIIRY